MVPPLIGLSEGALKNDVSQILTSSKDTLRERAHGERAALQAEKGDIGEALARNFSAGVNYGESGCAGGYAPIRSEADPRPILALLSDKGWQCALPTVSRESAHLVFRAWRPADTMTTGGYGIPEPQTDQPECVPDVLLVPMLAFDEFGHRLGYGAGHYDRTLARLRGEGDILAIGLAYAGSQVDSLPAADHDEPMDLIVTEAGIIQPKQASE